MSIFKPTKPAKLAEQQRKDAELGYLEHTKAAEYHAACAKMYKDRMKRLDEEYPPYVPGIAPPAPPRPGKDVSIMKAWMRG